MVRRCLPCLLGSLDSAVLMGSSVARQFANSGYLTAASKTVATPSYVDDRIREAVKEGLLQASVISPGLTDSLLAWLPNSLQKTLLHLEPHRQYLHLFMASRELGQGDASLNEVKRVCCTYCAFCWVQ